MTLKDKLHLNKNTTTSTTTNASNAGTTTGTGTGIGGKLRGLLHRSKSGSNINQGATQAQPGQVLPATSVQTITQTSATQTATTTVQTAALTQEDLPAPYTQLVGPPQTLAPVVIEEYIEYQPIIHRVIEVPQVQRIEQHSFERVASTGPSQITQPAIIQETIRPSVIEEVHPIVHREVSQPQIERIEQHISERLVQPTTVTKEVQNDGPPLQQQFVPAGGALGQQNAASAPLVGNNTSASSLRNV